MVSVDEGDLHQAGLLDEVQLGKVAGQVFVALVKDLFLLRDLTIAVM